MSSVKDRSEPGWAASAIAYTAGAMDTSGVIQSLFGVPRALVGVVHTGGLPGTPAGDQSIDQIVETAVAEARVYASAGFHGVMIENTHDRPYLKGSVGPEIVAALAVIGHEVRGATTVPVGVQVLAGANHCALAVSTRLTSAVRACAECFFLMSANTRM